MIAAGHGGSILNISSVRGQLGLRAGYSPYVASKGAMNMLTKQHAVEWAPHGIRVNAISPTFVRTKQVESMLADEAFYTSLVNRIPLGRIAEPGRPRRSGTLLLLGRVRLRDRPDPDDGRRSDRLPVVTASGRSQRISSATE